MYLGGAGYVLPADMPASARKFNDFYNAKMHKFRHIDPKKTSVYM